MSKAVQSLSRLVTFFQSLNVSLDAGVVISSEDPLSGIKTPVRDFSPSVGSRSQAIATLFKFHLVDAYVGIGIEQCKLRGICWVKTAQVPLLWAIIEVSDPLFRDQFSSELIT